MSPVGKNILAVVVGIIVGGALNMGIVMIGPRIIPPPEGVDVTNPESIAENLDRFEPYHFAVPFLAHALGTLAGAFTAAKIAASHKMTCALVVALVFFAGGLFMVVSIGGPLWFILVDLIVAYFPMAFLGGLLGGARTPKTA